MNANATLACAWRQSASERQRLHYDHVGLQAVSTGMLYFSIDIEDRRPLDINSVAVLDLDVRRRVAAVENGRHIDLVPFNLAAAISQHRYRIGAGGADAPCERQYIGQARSRVLKNIISRPRKLAEHMYLPAAYLHDRNRDLRVDDKVAALQLIGDPAARLRRGQAAQ